MTRKTTPLNWRLWDKIKITTDIDGCWEWQGALRNGYGVIGVGGRKDGIEYAHRLVYLEQHDFIPDGEEICHTCDNRKCCNPLHIFAGTRSDNMQGASQRNRIAVPNPWNKHEWHRVPAEWNGVTHSHAERAK